MWWAALAGRLTYLTHRASGHAVTWNALSRDSWACAGDIVCQDCGQVLWCRAHDPWRAARLEMVPDHSLFESLQHLLQLAEACPSGPSGDEIRRAACELIEAESAQRRLVHKRRMLKVLARLEWRQSRGRHRIDDPTPLMLKQLTDALRLELRPGSRPSRLDVQKQVLSP